MKTLSIKTKTILAINCGLIIGAVILIGVTRSSYRTNVDLVSRAALESAQRGFEAIRDGYTQSYVVASGLYMQNNELREDFIRRDRAAFEAHFMPAYQAMKPLGLIHTLFAEPNGTIFFRGSNPAKFGDSLNYLTQFEKAVQSQSVSAGIELTRNGFALGNTRPFLDKTGALIGYVVVGGSIDGILAAMKAQTKDDYLIVGFKSVLDESFYHSLQATKKLPDTWGQFKDVLVFSSTIAPDLTFDYGQYLQDLPAEGKQIGQAEVDGRSYAHGVFPLRNPAGKVVGAVFVLHDLTTLQQGLKGVERKTVATIALLMIFISLVSATILARLIFRRLQRTMDIATRVVGGSFDTQIIAESDDEVGRLETLLEQFRAVFVDMVAEVSARDKMARAGNDAQQSAPSKAG